MEKETGWYRKAEDEGERDHSGTKINTWYGTVTSECPPHRHANKQWSFNDGPPREGRHLAAPTRKQKAGRLVSAVTGHSSPDAGERVRVRIQWRYGSRVGCDCFVCKQE